MLKEKRGSAWIWILLIIILIIVVAIFYILFFTGFGDSVGGGILGSGIPSPPALPE